MGKRILGSAAALLFVAKAASAQSLPVIVFNDLKYGVSDILHVWTSPFRGEPRDYASAGLIIAGIGAVALADDAIGEWIYEHPDAGVLRVLDPFREGHWSRMINLGAGKSLLQVSGGLYLLGLITGSEELRAGAVGCTAAEKSNGIPRHYIYDGVSRERPLFVQPAGADTIRRRGDPYQIRFPGEESWYDNSFFGGHGANVMSCVSFFNHRYDLGYAEPVLWAVAGGLNIGRMADQRHWASDVAIGAVVGFAIGKYVAERSLARAEKRRDEGLREERGPRDEERRRSLLEGLYITRQAGTTYVGWKRNF